MTTATLKTVALVATLVVATLASGCAATPIPAPRSAGDLALAVPVDSARGEVDVVITGTDISRPVRSRLQVEDGVARGVVYDVVAGQNRRILLTARTADGRLCALELDAQVAGATVTEVQTGALQCQASHQAQTGSIASASSFNYASSDELPPIL